MLKHAELLSSSNLTTKGVSSSIANQKGLRKEIEKPRSGFSLFGLYLRDSPEDKKRKRKECAWHTKIEG
jgi:hypothetical protein